MQTTITEESFPFAIRLAPEDVPQKFTLLHFIGEGDKREIIAEKAKDADGAWTGEVILRWKRDYEES